MYTCDTILSARYMLTQNATRDVLENTTLAIQNGRIVCIGNAEYVRRHYAPKQDIDLGNAIIMPGLINAHTHASMTYARGIADDLPLMQWLTEHIFPLDRQLTTDGACSNNRLNMFTEMREAAFLHKVIHKDPTVLPAQSIFDMATHHGAQALMHTNDNARNTLGSLVTDCPADIIALSLKEPHMQPLYNPLSHIVYVATGMEVCLTMVAGETLYYNGQFTRFDYGELCKECEKMRAWVIKNRHRSTRV